MKIRRLLWSMMFCGLLAVPLAAREDDGQENGRREDRGFRHERRGDNEGGGEKQRGKRDGKGMRGGRRGDRMLKNIPGMEEERKRHHEEMKALMKDMNDTLRSARENVKNAEGEDAKKAALADSKEKVFEFAGKIVDARIAHEQKKVDLMKAGSQKMTEDVAKSMLKRFKKRRQRRGAKEGNDGGRKRGRWNRGGDNAGANNDNDNGGGGGEPRRDDDRQYAPRNDNRSHSKTKDNAKKDQDVASALEDALK